MRFFRSVAHDTRNQGIYRHIAGAVPQFTFIQDELSGAGNLYAKTKIPLHLTGENAHCAYFPAVEDVDYIAPCCNYVPFASRQYERRDTLKRLARTCEMFSTRRGYPNNVSSETDHLDGNRQRRGPSRLPFIRVSVSRGCRPKSWYCSDVKKGTATLRRGDASFGC